MPYSGKIWRGIKFSGLADFSKTAKFNSANRSTFVMKQWLILSFRQIKIRQTLRISKLPNKSAAKFSRYTVYSMFFETYEILVWNTSLIRQWLLLLY